jgi:hypothetical protein
MVWQIARHLRLAGRRLWPGRHAAVGFCSGVCQAWPSQRTAAHWRETTHRSARIIQLALRRGVQCSGGCGGSTRGVLQKASRMDVCSSSACRFSSASCAFSSSVVGFGGKILRLWRPFYRRLKISGGHAFLRRPTAPRLDIAGLRRDMPEWRGRHPLNPGELPAGPPGHSQGLPPGGRTQSPARSQGFGRRRSSAMDRRPWAAPTRLPRRKVCFDPTQNKLQASINCDVWAHRHRTIARSEGIVFFNCVQPA